jgi:preprotein translocase subunit SecD
MFWLGSGPIRGFAVTLSLGILTSVFAAVTITRLLVAMWLKNAKTIKGRPIELPI